MSIAHKIFLGTLYLPRRSAGIVSKLVIKEGKRGILGDSME